MYNESTELLDTPNTYFRLCNWSTLRSNWVELVATVLYIACLVSSAFLTFAYSTQQANPLFIIPLCFLVLCLIPIVIVIVYIICYHICKRC